MALFEYRQWLCFQPFWLNSQTKGTLQIFLLDDLTDTRNIPASRRQAECHHRYTDTYGKVKSGLLALSLPLWPCFSLWTWCLFLVYLALTLGFSSKTLAWLLTGSSSEHPECAAFFRVYFLASNKLDQQQAGLTGQWIQWCQKALRNGHVHPGSMRSFELMQNHFP